MRRWCRLVIALVVGLGWLAGAMPAGATPTANQMDFWTTQARADRAVDEGLASRSWVWGPAGQPFRTWAEPYSDAPGGWRFVGYTDKGRMEVTPGTDTSSPWHVGSGLLAQEMVTGRVQLGYATFQDFPPAALGVAGDPDDTGGPTYAALRPLLDYRPIPTNWLLVQTVDRAGTVGADPALGRYRVSARDVGAPTGHTVASVFSDFMNSSGLLYTDDASHPVNGFPDPRSSFGWFYSGPLFPSPFYATGYPITEAYWSRVKVGGTVENVLIQCFQRRCLTYTPANPFGWRIEMGNIGRQYEDWRYGQLGFGSARVAGAALTPDNVLIFTDIPGAIIGSARDFVTMPLAGITTLEPGECQARQAWNEVVRRLAVHDQPLAIEGTGEAYWAAPYRLWLDGTQELFNETLVRDGYAKVDSAHPDPLYQSRLVAAQQLAQQAHRGICGACP